MCNIKYVEVLELFSSSHPLGLADTYLYWGGKHTIFEDERKQALPVFQIWKWCSSAWKKPTKI
jgi:hypothetical protein